MGLKSDGTDRAEQQLESAGCLHSGDSDVLWSVRRSLSKIWVEDSQAAQNHNFNKHRSTLSAVEILVEVSRKIIAMLLVVY
jgi:hypothetical protein